MDAVVAVAEADAGKVLGDLAADISKDAAEVNEIGLRMFRHFALLQVFCLPDEVIQLTHPELGHVLPHLF